MAVSRVAVERVRMGRLPALAEEWRALAAACGLDAPFLTYEWVSTWLRHFPERRLAIVDDPVVLTLRDPPSGALVGIAPLVLTRRPRALGVRMLDFLGADPNVTELRGLLCRPSHEEAVWTAVLEETSRMSARWDWMHLRGVPEGSRLHELLEARGDLEWFRRTPAYVVPLPASWDELKRSLPRNTKEALRRAQNALARDGITCGLEVARAPAEVPAALERFHQLHRARAERTDTVQHFDVFESPVARAFLADVCRTFAERGALRILQLRAGGEIVAVRIGFVVGETLYLYFSGYDPAWADYHVMTRALAEGIQQAIAEGLRAVHLSTGRDQSKLRWRPRETVYLDAVLRSPSLRGRLAHRVFQALDRHLRHAEWARPLLGRRARRPEDAAPGPAAPDPAADAAAEEAAGEPEAHSPSV